MKGMFLDDPRDNETCDLQVRAPRRLWFLRMFPTFTLKKVSLKDASTLAKILARYGAEVSTVVIIK